MIQRSRTEQSEHLVAREQAYRSERRAPLRRNRPSVAGQKSPEKVVTTLSRRLKREIRFAASPLMTS